MPPPRKRYPAASVSHPGTQNSVELRPDALEAALFIVIEELDPQSDRVDAKRKSESLSSGHIIDQVQRKCHRDEEFFHSANCNGTRGQNIQDFINPPQVQRVCTGFKQHTIKGVST